MLNNEKSKPIPMRLRSKDNGKKVESEDQL
jgi:hypothetical protein